MRGIFKCLGTSALSFLCIVGHGQIVSGDMFGDDRSAYVNITSMGDFVERFNGNLKPVQMAGVVVDSLPAADTLSARGKGILLLFDGKVDELFQDSLLCAFCKDVERKGLILELSDSCNEVRTDMDFIYGKNETVPMSVYYKTMVKDSTYSWYISRVESALFTYGNKDRKSRIPIPSASIGFINIKDYLGGNPADLTGGKHSPDNLSAFLFLTSHGLLRYHITTMVTMFFQIGDYRLKVMYCTDVDTIRSGYMVVGLRYKEKFLFPISERGG